MSEPGALPDWAAGPVEDDEGLPDWAEAPAQPSVPEGPRYSGVRTKELSSFDEEDAARPQHERQPEVRGHINMAPLTEVVGDTAREGEIELPDPIRRGMEFVVNDLRRSTMSPAERSADQAHGRAYSAASVNPVAAPVTMMDDLSFGHLDEIGGALRSGAVSGEAYRREQQESRRRLDELAQRNPVSAGGGHAGALGVMAAVPGLGGLAGEAAAARGAGAIAQGAARLGGAAIEGAGFGGLSASGASEGSLGSDEYRSDVGGGVGIGAALGGGGQLVGELGSAGMSALRRSITGVADRLRVRAAGGRMADQRLLERTFPGGVSGMADTLRREGLSGPMMTTGELAERAREVNQRAGQAIGDIIDRAGQETGEAGYRSAAGAGVDPHQLAATVRREIVEPLEAQTTQQARAAAASVNRWIDNVQEVYGDRRLTPADLQRLKRELDAVIPYGQAAALDRVGTEATRGARDVVRRELDTTVERAGQQTGDPAMLENLRRERAAFGATSRVGDWAEREAARESSNRLLSPTDYLTGVAGVGAAAADGELSAQDIATTGALALANRFVRRREHSLAASGLENLGRALDVPGRLRLSPTIANALRNARTRGPAAYAATVYAATMNASPEEREAIQQAMEGGAPSQETP